MGRKRSIQRRILIPIFLLLAVQAILLTCGIYFLGFFQNIDNNAFSNLKKTVTSQEKKLEDEMTTHWGKIDSLEDKMNQSYEELVQKETIKEGGLQSDDKQYNAYLNAVLPKMISTLRTNGVNGVFVVLTSKDTLSSKDTINYPGIYVEDQDVTASYNMENKDLLLSRGSLSVVKNSGISTRPGWSPTFRFDGSEDIPDFIKKPLKAVESGKAKSYQDALYWGKPVTLKGASEARITCSIPLISKSGSIYGVVGVSINESYLEDQLPYVDLAYNKDSAYCMIQDKQTYATRLFDNGSDKLLGQISQTYSYKKVDGFQKIITKDHNIDYGYSRKLHIYDSSSAFASEEWSFVGVVSKDTLLQLTTQTKTLLIGILVFVFVTSFVGILFIAKRISKPVVTLIEEVKHADVGERTKIKKTDVYELDFLADAIEQLSLDAYMTAGTFTRIMEMSTVKMGGFEYDKEQNRLMVTEHFFDVFGKPELDGNVKSWNEFVEAMEVFKNKMMLDTSYEGYNEKEYKLPMDRGYIWVRLKSTTKGNRTFGLAEDITSEKLQIQKVEHERDHDILTNLLNRRSFQREMNELFKQGESVLKVAALMMLDLDNLKYINDNFGHDAGDNYIVCMANHLRHIVDSHVLVARMSGDEFYLFFYGYSGQDEIREQVRVIYEKMKTQSITLPNGERHFIRASAGLSWYPSDADTIASLLLYADFAMYKVKNSVKGAYAEFEKAVYKKEAYLVQNRETLHKLLSKELIDYHFQPIIDVRTKEIYGYEALMRPQVSELGNVEELLRLARREGMLRSVETITFFKSVEYFLERSKKLKNQKAKLFINSLSNQKMAHEKEEEFKEIYANYLDRIVVEITEVTELNQAIHQKKVDLIKQSGGQIALDDFGTGYNGDVALLRIYPNIVKIDIAIVSDIDQDKDKQQVVAHLIEYAAQKDIKVLAEGVETKEEYDTVVAMGVDYAQGYYIARPAAMPTEINFTNE